nr:MAG: hypothetical protein DIU62_00195 [Pseudomonadota bacterium]
MWPNSARQYAPAGPDAGPRCAAHHAARITAPATSSTASVRSARERAQAQRAGWQKRAQMVVSRPRAPVRWRNWAGVITAYLARSMPPSCGTSRYPTFGGSRRLARWARADPGHADTSSTST